MPDNDYTYDDSDDIGLGDEGREEFKRDSEDFLKMEKGQILRAAFVYFHTVDANAVAIARKNNPKLTPDQIREVARKALADHAAKLTPPKAPDTLTAIERLDTSSVHFKKFMGHFQQGLGYVISRLGKDGAEADAIWRKLPEPRKYYTTVLMLYATDKHGEIDRDKDRFANGWQIKKWRFGKNIYEAFWKLNASLKELGQSLATQDIKLECKDPQFQKIDITFAGASIWQKAPTFRQRVLEQAIVEYPKLIPFRELSTDQLRAKLGMAGPVVTDVAAGGDFADLLENV